MATVNRLPKDLFKIGKYYSMIRNKQELRFKVHSYNEFDNYFELHTNFTMVGLGQLEDEDIKTIQEITAEECGPTVTYNDKGQLVGPKKNPPTN